MEAIRAFLNERLPNYLDLLKEMVAINSFTANAAGVNRLGEFTARAFAPLGFRAEFVPSINPQFGRHLFLYSTSSALEDSRPTIALISHLDTVFPPEEERAHDFAWRVIGDRAYGPGTVDVKGGTVLALMVLEALSRFYPKVFERVQWVVALDASEETISNDFGEALLHRLPTRNTLACLVFEGATPSPKGFSLVTSRKGRSEFQVNVAGRGAHAGNYHRQGANAIVQLAHTITRIASLTDYSRSLTFNIGFAQGGSVANRVPHEAFALGEMRAFDLDSFEHGLAQLLALDGVSHVASEDGYRCQVRIQIRSQTPPWPANPATERLLAVWQAAAREIGQEVFAEARGGLSDGNLLWQHHPTLDGLGPIGNNAHCSERSADGAKDQEYVLISSFVPKALLNLAALLRLLETG